MNDWFFLASAIGAGVFAARVAALVIERLMQRHRDNVWRRDFDATISGGSSHARP
jgi:hypothetical protein